MNLDTITQQIASRVRSMLEESEIWVAVIDSLRFHRYRVRDFNKTTFHFLLTENKEVYAPGEGLGTVGAGIPREFCRPIGDFEISRAGATRKETLPNVTKGMLSLMERSSQPISFEDPSTVDIYGFGVFGTDIRVSPVPRASGDVVYGTCLLDFPAPVAEYDSSAQTWKFWKPDKSAELTGKWSNPWLDNDEEIIRLKAVATLGAGILSDQRLADAALGEWSQLVAEEEVGTRKGRGHPRVKPWL